MHIIYDNKYNYDTCTYNVILFGDVLIFYDVMSIWLCVLVVIHITLCRDVVINDHVIVT